MVLALRSSSMAWLLVTVLATTGDAVTVDVKFPYRESLEYKASLQKGVEAALNYIEAEVKSHPDHEDLQFALAALYWQYDQEKAYDQLRELLTVNPRHTEGRYLTGVILYHWDKLQLAGDQFAAVVQNDPMHVQAYNGLVAVLAKMNRFQEAVGVLSHAQSLMPQEESFYFNQAINYSALGKEQYKAAIPNLEKAIALNSRDGEYYYFLGMLYFEEKQFELARPALTKALELNPKNAIALLTLASSYHQEQNFKKAIELANQALALDPYNQDIVTEIEEYKKGYEQWKEDEGQERTP